MHNIIWFIYATSIGTNIGKYFNLTHSKTKLCLTEYKEELACKKMVMYQYLSYFEENLRLKGITNVNICMIEYT